MVCVPCDKSAACPGCIPASRPIIDSSTPATLPVWLKQD
uniref:Uncharacterized protein n=1 Tax=Anguilla anguilla TaxID=7936 RepID=A0A0E9VH83_ANGAN